MFLLRHKELSLSTISLRPKESKREQRKEWYTREVCIDEGKTKVGTQLRRTPGVIYVDGLEPVRSVDLKLGLFEKKYVIGQSS